MKKSRSRTGKKIAALVLVLSLSVLVIAVSAAGLFNYLEYKTYDFRVNALCGLTRPSEDIMVILLDQSSIDWAKTERGWAWPWPRKAYGEILDYMNAANARAVAFDVLFTEPSVYGPADDEAFQRAALDYGRAVQAVYFNTLSGNDTGHQQASSWDSPLFEPESFGTLLPRFSPSAWNPEHSETRAQFPVPPLLESAGAVGSVWGHEDSDSIYRRSTLFTLFDDNAVPDLSSALLLAAGAEKKLQYLPGKNRILWGDYQIPVDKNGRSLLRFRGALDRYTPYTAAEILRSAEYWNLHDDSILPPKNYLPPEDFSDKYVFFGFFAPGLFDICPTPVSSSYPGVGMHITMLDNIISGDFIRESPFWLNSIIIFAALALVVFAVLFSGRIPLAVGGALLILIAVTGLGFLAYHYGGLWTPLAAPIAGIFFAFVSATVYNYATEGSQKRFIKSAFSQYLSPTVIEQLLANPELLTLGGERREISIFFSDVQGFTTISEKLDPAKLTELLNDYLSFMTDTILDSGGTIDKYEGDAIIAFWNAPLQYDDHAARALAASMACQEKLAERQDYFEEKFGCRLLTRIGLNTGFAVVGNMGSSKRFDYTMLGDSVNLAARLEGLNKQFGTYLMCTENTFKKASLQTGFFGRRLAQVAVVGKKEPVTVYEPLTEKFFRQKEAILKSFDEARDLFYAGNFTAAETIFGKIASEDPPARFYAEQCRYYRDNPAEWKGFWQSRTK